MSQFAAYKFEVAESRNTMKMKLWRHNIQTLKNPFGKPQAEVDFACVYNS